MTPQDIREKIFEKAVFGGYDMGSVDDFMEEMASELEAAQRESATLKAKMKVLVDKIEEYRASEDAMRMTLLSAQKLSSQIEAEARARADKVVAEAQATAARSLDGLKSETRREEARLKEAKESLARFLEDARALCHFEQALGVRRARDDLRDGGVAQDPRGGDGGLGDAVLCGYIRQSCVEGGEFGVV